MASRNFESNCGRGIPMFGMTQSIDVTGNMCEGKEIDRFLLKRRNRLDKRWGGLALGGLVVGVMQTCS
jgi:hypothetical protein